MELFVRYLFNNWLVKELKDLRLKGLKSITFHGVSYITMDNEPCVALDRATRPVAPTFVCIRPQDY